MTCRPPETYADPRDVAELAEPLRSRVAQLIADAPTGGLVLISGMRTPWQQWVLRHQRCPGRECDPACKGSPLTALPGRSKHQRGEAADLGGREMIWAGRNAARYGLHRPVPGEPWHFEPNGQPQVQIKPWAPTSNEGRPWLPFRRGDNDRSIYRRGGRDNQVAELQMRLLFLSNLWNAPDLEPGPIDGAYGRRSAEAVIAFKHRIRDLQRYTGQPEWTALDDNVGPLTIAMARWWTP